MGHSPRPSKVGIHSWAPRKVGGDDLKDYLASGHAKLETLRC